MKIAEKVVRIESDAYEYVVDFANEHYLKIGEAVSILIRYCVSKDLIVKQAHVEVVEVQNVVEED
ncbi:TPA: hypothetical protein TZE23_001285 [Streptococcus suis]|nr:hypothetical protein [Streptococcus suis]